jgi:hypothetical protein
MYDQQSQYLALELRKGDQLSAEIITKIVLLCHERTPQDSSHAEKELLEKVDNLKFASGNPDQQHPTHLPFN